MLPLRTKSLTLFILIIKITNYLCCDTFNNIPVQFGKTSDGSDIEIIDITGCINDEEKYKDIQLIRVHHTSPIPTLKKDSIANLPKLQIIFFKFNNIKSIEPGSLINLPKLKYLAIVNNTINDIKPYTFKDLPVEVLFLSNNKIKEIQIEAFFNMPNLDTLYLNNNELQYFHRQWFKSTNKLRSLVLTNNKLLSLPSQAFGNTPSVQLLGLSRNNIRSIHPTAFKGLELLKELDLSKNHLKELPSNVFESIDSCEYIYLNNNNLTFIHDKQLQDLKYLTEFTVHSNPMQCSCMFKIEKWAKRNSISLNGFNKKCLVADNPVCALSTDSEKSQCIENVQDDLIDHYYKHFVHPEISCDDDPIEL